VSTASFPKGATNPLVRMVKADKQELDSIASKLASKHKQLTGELPQAWINYQNIAEERDELIGEL